MVIGAIAVVKLTYQAKKAKAQPVTTTVPSSDHVDPISTYMITTSKARSVKKIVNASSTFKSPKVMQSEDLKDEELPGWLKVVHYNILKMKRDERDKRVSVLN